MSAAIITANMTPRAPVGKSSITKRGYAIFVHPPSFPQIALHSAGSAHATSSENNEQFYMRFTADKYIGY